MDSSDLQTVSRLFSDEPGQNIPEYTVMLAVILVLVVGTIRLVGSTPTTSSHRLPARFNRPLHR